MEDNGFKQQDESYYDCSKYQQHLAYERIFYDLHKNDDIEYLKELYFDKKVKYERITSFDDSCLLTIMISFTMIMIQTVLESLNIDKSTIIGEIFSDITQHGIIFTLVIAFVVWANYNTNSFKQLLKLRLEKQVIEELIAGKSQHKAKVKVRKIKKSA